LNPSSSQDRNLGPLPFLHDIGAQTIPDVQDVSAYILTQNMKI
jgi:hypothetical protein